MFYGILALMCTESVCNAPTIFSNMAVKMNPIFMMEISIFTFIVEIEYWMYIDIYEH